MRIKFFKWRGFILKTKQVLLIQRLHELFVEINEEAINDEQFNNWLSENYFFEEDLEDILIQLKNIKENIS